MRAGPLSLSIVLALNDFSKFSHNFLSVLVSFPEI